MSSDRLSDLVSGHEGPIAVSRAMSPALEARLAGVDQSPRPLLRGRTVWSAGEDVTLAVLESPNRYGLSEAHPSTEWVAVVWHPESGLPEWSERDGVVIIEAQESPPSDGYLDRTVAAQLLAKHLNQIRGLSLPFGEPESPVFVISLEAGTEVLEPLSPVIGNTVRLEAIAVPGVPGTARIEVLDGRSAEMREVATAIRDVIGRRGEAAA